MSALKYPKKISITFATGLKTLTGGRVKRLEKIIGNESLCLPMEMDFLC